MDKKNLFSVIYKDSNILVVNKGSGLSVTQDRWDPEIPRLDTLLENEYGKVFTVHRIDKDTSGVVVYALNPDTHRFLSGEFEERRVEKTYIALVYGSPEWQEKKIEIKLKQNGSGQKTRKICPYKMQGSGILPGFFLDRSKTGNRPHPPDKNPP